MVNVLIMFDSKEAEQLERYSREKGNIFEWFKNNDFRYEKKTDYVLVFDRITYHFLDTSKRNLKKFFETYTHFDHVFAFLNTLTLEQKELLATVFDPEQVLFNFNISKLVQPYKNTYKKIEVFYLDFPLPTKVLKEEIYEYKFNKDRYRFHKQYLTKEEALKELKSICEERIQSNTRQLAIIQKRIEDDKKMLEKLEKY